jgi:murein DD-endopeptidase MepM/ murein hydrolase activator NlpD
MTASYTDSRRRGATLRAWVRGATLLLGAIVLTLSFDVPAAHAATAKQLADQLAAIKKQVQVAGSAYDKALTKYETTGGKIKATTKAIASENEKLRTAESVLALRADAMYRNDPTDGAIAFMLGSEDFNDLISRLTYIELITKADSELVGSIKDARLALSHQRSTLATTQVAQKADLTDANKKMTAMQASLNAKQAEYARLLDALNAQLAREKASGKQTWLPSSPNGWVFPVQGAHTYSDTFGAPRSGGRKHKGCDIFASRGTPAVAIVSGTVRTSNGGLGGKCIWLTGDNGSTFYYAHLDSFVVTSGRVSAGQLIARVGNTGNAAGGACHLHFEIHPGGGAAVDPYATLRSID